MYAQFMPHFTPPETSPHDKRLPSTNGAKRVPWNIPDLIRQIRQRLIKKRIIDSWISA